MPVRTASAERANMGGGFIEFLFSDSQSGRRYQPPHSYTSRRRCSRRQTSANRCTRRKRRSSRRVRRDPKFKKQTVSSRQRSPAPS